MTQNVSTNYEKLSGKCLTMSGMCLNMFGMSYFDSERGFWKKCSHDFWYFFFWSFFGLFRPPPPGGGNGDRLTVTNLISPSSTSMKNWFWLIFTIFSLDTSFKSYQDLKLRQFFEKYSFFEKSSFLEEFSKFFKIQ